MKFALIGDGKVAQHHRKAIENVGGELCYVYDIGRKPYGDWNEADYTVICTPSDSHKHYTIESLERGIPVIVEKPMCLPWEKPIDSDDVNVVMQMRYADLSDSAKQVSVRMVRDEAYFKSWKGDARKTGGIFYNLFIHYIDLAIIFDADFDGIVASEGEQYRRINGIDLLNIDMDKCYTRLYEDILNGNGIKPSSLEYLYWRMDKAADLYGFNGVGNHVFIKKELL